MERVKINPLAAVIFRFRADIPKNITLLMKNIDLLVGIFDIPKELLIRKEEK